jgi:hypothetical protein
MSEAGCAWSQNERQFPLVRIVLVGALMFVCWNGTSEPVLAQVPRIQGQGTAASGMAMRFPPRPMTRRRSTTIPPA